MSDPNNAALPARIGGRYVVLEQLGRGGMAVVYRVRDQSAAHDVALKQLVATGTARDAEAFELFEREFQVLAQLRHPSVIAVYDFGFEGATPFYTMELLDGGDLGARAPLPWTDACLLMMQVCSSLSLVHSRRLVHRDVSPRNVRCTRAGAAKLIDFGAMVPMGPCLHSVGTAGFVAPEVLHHWKLDARTDLFSLGATLYFALTGRRPFAARTLAELNEAWRVEPQPPGQFVPDIPPALDELLISLLRIDPARRPRSAFEVMQRLAAIAGLSPPNAEESSGAYLATPTLVGREAEQRRFRQCVRRAKNGEGGTLLLQAGAGMGRSRLLDMCCLEGKTAGASVLRLDGSSVRHEPFAAAQRLAEQLLQSAPDAPYTDLVDPATFARLFPAAQLPALELVSRAQLQAAPHSAQAALLAWFLAASKQRLLMIAIDDLERIDDASQAWIAALAHAAIGCRLLIVGTLPEALDEQAQPAFAVLRQHSVDVTLEPLSAEQNEAMFASIFFEAPHVALVSDRIHQLAAGRPREALALARHLLDTGRIRFADGNWTLPAELTASDLPASAEAALRLRIARLEPYARRLVEAQALALDTAWTRADYLALEPGAASLLDGALATLVVEGVLASDGETYTLSRLGAAHILDSELCAADRLERQRALVERSLRTDRPLLFEVHHRLLARDGARALDRLAPVLTDGSNATSVADSSGLSRKAMSQIIEQALHAAISCQRSLREINELRRVLVELSATSDHALFERYAPAWLEQLELDSGQRESRAPQAERVYGVEEAIKYLARYVVFAAAMGVQTNDTRLLRSLPEILAPFAAEMPALHAIREMSLGLHEMVSDGQLERARLRYRAHYEQLQGMSNRDIGYLDGLRFGAAYSMASLEVVLGYPTALHWIELAEQSPLYRVNALLLRRLLCVFEGDAEGAERLRRQAELVAARASARQVNQVPLTIELHAQVHAGDLTGVQHVAERTGRLAVHAPGWSSLHHAAQGHYQLLRGDLQAAKLEFERALRLSDPARVSPLENLRAWVSAVAGYIRVLTELGAYDEACRFGADAVARCESLEITDGCAQIRALALAEAKAGRHQAAAQRLDRLIAQRAGRNPALVAADLEARALVAIWAQDHAAAAHFTELATRSHRRERTALELTRRGRLLEEAARAGVPLELPPSGFERVVLGAAPRSELAAVDAKFVAALEALRDPKTRSHRALELLCEAATAQVGHLYILRADAAQRSASRGVTPDARLDEFVQRYLRQQIEEAAMSTIFTATEQAANAPPVASWSSERGATYSIATLKPLGRDQFFGAVALLAPAAGLRHPQFSARAGALSARLLELGDVGA